MIKKLRNQPYATKWEREEENKFYYDCLLGPSNAEECMRIQRYILTLLVINLKVSVD
jgi:hypothetical protein